MGKCAGLEGVLSDQMAKIAMAACQDKGRGKRLEPGQGPAAWGLPGPHPGEFAGLEGGAGWVAEEMRDAYLALVNALEAQQDRARSGLRRLEVRGPREEEISTKYPPFPPIFCFSLVELEPK